MKMDLFYGEEIEKKTTGKKKVMKFGRKKDLQDWIDRAPMNVWRRKGPVRKPGGGRLRGRELGGRR